MCAARILILGTPVYRATYSALVKARFDRLPDDALAGCVCLLVATAAGDRHYLVVDAGLRALVTSVGGWSAPRTIYFVNGQHDERLIVGATASVLDAAQGFSRTPHVVDNSLQGGDGR
jgi:NAD(P)H-dependent FMN reductase